MGIINWVSLCNWGWEGGLAFLFLYLVLFTFSYLDCYLEQEQNNIWNE